MAVSLDRVLCTFSVSVRAIHYIGTLALSHFEMPKMICVVTCTNIARQVSPEVYVETRADNWQGESPNASPH